MDEAATAFPWPSPPGVTRRPRWNGRGFDIDGRAVGVLSLEAGASGWSDDLTSLHEEHSSPHHPIDIASRARAVAELRRLVRRRATILEVGCSSGYLLQDVRAALPDALVIGADYLPGALERLARRRPDQPLLQFDLSRCPLPDACVDAVVALNVLEHIADDHAAVRETFRVLRPGGVAVIEVPAGPRLYDVYDKVLMHYRRYSTRDAVAMFRNAGFDVAPPSHLGFFLFPAFALVKLKNRSLLGKPEAEQRAIAIRAVRRTRESALVRGLLALERAGAGVVRYPFGIRCVFTATKPPRLGGCE
jgi:SAM-dependent methyltransferase